MSVSSWSWTITAIALGLSYLGTEWEYGALPPPPPPQLGLNGDLVLGWNHG